MKKIALVILQEELKDWSGGISYYENFIKILSKIKKIKIIIFTDSKSFIHKRVKPKRANIFEEKFLIKNNFLYILRKILSYFTKKDIILYNKLISEKIDILSHRRLFKNNKIKSFGWIPDLQHKKFKEMFANRTYLERERYVQDEINKSDYIFVSSEQVKKEFKQYYKNIKNIIPLIIPLKIEKPYLKNKKRFILFPSQFWKHKNHIFLIKVAKNLKEKNINIKFIFCGKTTDYRNKLYFNNIKNEIYKNKLEDYIKILGEVSKKKLLQLQKDCMAMINCSLYEGWSTVNEEAKKLNKFIFLSKIHGHYEQNNQGSIYFSLKDPNDLTKKILNFIEKKTYKKEKKLFKKNKILYQKNFFKAEKKLLKYYTL